MNQPHPTRHLIVVTRYPEPGKAKTRLIPALGPEGAATVHRQMAEHTLAQASAVQASQAVSLEIWFAGGSVGQMQDWLGKDRVYRVQGEGDLGDRLLRACQSAFSQGSTAVVIVGTDCPELDETLLTQAFQHLQQQDVVLGPAQDGGYYLIGLRRAIPELFQAMPWSTVDVLRQTQERATRLGLTIAYLPTLSDVDLPEDLAIWKAATAKLSIIIPVLNEAANLDKTLAAAQTGANTEIIVVDGGSHDPTVAIAQAAGAQVVTASPGRAVQMNAGAAVATGDLLLFLHGDTRLPAQFDRLIRRTLRQPATIAGAFELQIDGSQPGLRLIERGVRWRSRWLQLPYGDQALFLKASVFHEIGGFPELPIMEDFELVRRLQHLGKIAIAPAAVLTSARRWQALGILQTTLLNQAVVIAYFLGIPPAELARWYRNRKQAEKSLPR